MLCGIKWQCVCFDLNNKWNWTRITNYVNKLMMKLEQRFNKSNWYIISVFKKAKIFKLNALPKKNCKKVTSSYQKPW